jgi:transposase
VKIGFALPQFHKQAYEIDRTAEKAGLKVRTWTCGCGRTHDRDQNAEYNLRVEGRRIVAAGRADT